MAMVFEELGKLRQIKAKNDYGYDKSCFGDVAEAKQS